MSLVERTGRAPTGLSGAEEQPEISVVTAILNEEETVAALFERLRSVLARIGRAYEIIAVDDGSTDRTFSLLRDQAERDRRVRVVRFRRRFGQTAALAAGFERARGAIVVTIDADLQNDPEDIAPMLDKLEEGYDVVSGWRVDRQDPFFSRRLPSRIANRLISWTTGVKLHDYGCALKVYRTAVLHNIQLYGELHRFIPAIASWQGIAVTELPVHHAPRKAGRSKYGISRTLRVLLDIVTVRFLLTYSTRPMHVFGTFGLVTMFLGVAISGYLAVKKLFFGAQLANRPLLLLGVLLVVVGVQFIGIGLVGELIVRNRGQSEFYVVREELNEPSEPPGSGSRAAAG